MLLSKWEGDLMARFRDVARFLGVSDTGEGLGIECRGFDDAAVG